MSRDIKSIAMVLRALTHLSSKGIEFGLLTNGILHRVGKKRVSGLAIYHREGGALESPLVVIHNHLYDPKGIKVAFDQQIDMWSLPRSDFAAIRQACADSPYADATLRAMILNACGLEEIHFSQRPFVKKPKR